MVAIQRSLARSPPGELIFCPCCQMNRHLNNTWSRLTISICLWHESIMYSIYHELRRKQLGQQASTCWFICSGHALCWTQVCMHWGGWQVMGWQGLKRQCKERHGRSLGSRVIPWPHRVYTLRTYIWRHMVKLAFGHGLSKIWGWVSSEWCGWKWRQSSLSE